MTGLRKAVKAIVLLVMLGGCAVGAQREYMMAPDTANYTDKYIDYTLYDATGRNLGLGGEAKPFNKGRTGGFNVVSCCLGQDRSSTSAGTKKRKTMILPGNVAIRRTSS